MSNSEGRLLEFGWGEKLEVFARTGDRDEPTGDWLVKVRVGANSVMLDEEDLRWLRATLDWAEQESRERG